MKDFRTLKILDAFSGFFERLGVDYPIMRKILVVKLTMDGRRTPTIFNQQGNKKKKPEENGFIKSLWIYVLMSLMLIPVVNLGTSYLYQMSLFYGIVMFLVMTSMISDFSNVLLDVRDKGILLTKPINKKTVSAAKTVHISIYLFFLTIAISAVPMIVGAFRHGLLFFLLSLLGLLLLDLFIVVLTAIIYYFILRFFDGEKLKDIINYVQIGLSISIAVGYQILVRAFSIVDLKITFTPSWWQFLVPPIWFGAPFELIFGHLVNQTLYIYSVLALIVPILAIMIYARMLPSFEQNLQKLSNNSGEGKRKERKWKNIVVKLLCRNNEEKMFFRFADHMMRNEREFRLKVYPSLGMSLVFPFIFMFNEIQMNSYAHLVESKWYLTIYMSCTMIPGAVTMLKYSGKYKGAWVFRAAPLHNLAPLFSGVLKVFIVNLFFPVYFILCIIFIGIFGFKVIPDLVVVMVTAVLYTVISTIFLKGTLPFSESFQDVKQNGGLQMIGALLLIGIFIGIHFAVTFIPFGVFIYLIILSVITLFSWKRAYKTIWSIR
ncbi:hypothetical protein [Neobacillus sp. LXY-1]|uniref:hypothetical protein n=1 Tax=Neobacillus sp. LXY-1 TaxID=3379133 RepID=UPI003EE3EC9F